MATEQPINVAQLLAADHKGMRINYAGLLKQASSELSRTAPGRAEMLRQMEEHIAELGRRFYAGDLKVVDEFLQLYCVAKDAREAIPKPLWCIYIPGPCDVYAAPSKEAAQHMAEQHNAAMTAYLEGHPELLDRWGVTLESIRAEARSWDHGSEEHAEDLAEFNADEWGWDLANNCAKGQAK